MRIAVIDESRARATIIEEGLRAFDAASQRTTGTLTAATLRPVSEVLLDEASISRFRSGYRVLFAKAGDDDPLYGAVTAGQRQIVHRQPDQERP